MKTAQPKQRNESLDSFTFYVQRDFSDDPIELAVEIRTFIPENENGGCADERRGPAVELGDAWTVPDARYFELTPTEREQAEEYAIMEIQSRPSYEEEQYL